MAKDKSKVSNINNLTVEQSYSIDRVITPTNNSEITEIRTIVEKAVENNIQCRAQIVKMFRYVLVSRFLTRGAFYNPYFINVDYPKGEYRKYFAFVETDITKLTLGTLFERIAYIERLLETEISNSGLLFEQIEFNFAVLENLRGKYDFADLFRGIFIWRAIQND